MRLNFKNFLLTEENQYLGARIGDILNAIQDLSGDAPNMGTRQLATYVEHISNQIRQILRSRWSMQQRPYLEVLQRAGVAMMKAADEGGDLPSTISSVAYELQTLSGKLGTPVNQMGSGD